MRANLKVNCYTIDKKLSPSGMARIRVQDIIMKDGWHAAEGWHGIQRLELIPRMLGNGTIQIDLFRNGELIRHPMCRGYWLVSEQAIAHLPHHRDKGTGEIVRRSPMEVYYILGPDNRRYRFLYFHGFPDGSFVVGTRNELKQTLRTKYKCRSMSNKRRLNDYALDRWRKKCRHMRELKIQRRFRKRYPTILSA
jgi:hypothetical protein